MKWALNKGIVSENSWFVIDKTPFKAEKVNKVGNQFKNWTIEYKEMGVLKTIPFMKARSISILK